MHAIPLPFLRHFCTLLIFIITWNAFTEIIFNKISVINFRPPPPTSRSYTHLYVYVLGAFFLTLTLDLPSNLTPRNHLPRQFHFRKRGARVRKTENLKTFYQLSKNLFLRPRTRLLTLKWVLFCCANAALVVLYSLYINILFLLTFINFYDWKAEFFMYCDC